MERWAILLAGFGIIFLTWRHYRNKRRHKQQLAAYRQEYETNSMKMQLEMHEQTGQLEKQQLQAIIEKLVLVNIQTETAAMQAPGLPLPGALLRESIDDMRYLMHKVSYRRIKDMGIAQVIREDIAPLEKAGTPKISLHAHGPWVVEEVTEILLYRVFSEAMQQILEKTEPTWIKISLGYEDNFMSMSVINDGNQIYKTPGDKFSYLAQRAENLGGSLRLDSEATGNFLVIEIPLNND